MSSAAGGSPTSSSAAAAEGNHRLHSDSLPLIDLRLLTQSELYSLSLCTSSAASSAQDDGVLIPTIDRSVFNESAGSRKQTFSRLRLAPRGAAPSAVPSHSRQKSPEPIDAENSRILALLQELFVKDAPPIDPTSMAVAAGAADVAAGFYSDADLIQVPVEQDDCVPDPSKSVVQSVPIEVVDLGPVKRKRGRPRKCERRAASEGGDASALVAAIFNEDAIPIWDDSGHEEDNGTVMETELEGVGDGC